MGHAAPIVSAMWEGHGRQAGWAGCTGWQLTAALTPCAAQPWLSGRQQHEATTHTQPGSQALRQAACTY